jgi:uncharacterized protein YbjT (DUF2867 family)
MPGPECRVDVRIVVIGGYGNFGARICRALAGQSGIEVCAAGRHPGSAPADIAGDARTQKVQLDFLSPDFPEALKKLSPQIVIHCAGPFQGQDYRVAAAAFSAGAHYIDIADGREFVCQFAMHNQHAANAAGLFAVSGASTLPGLSSAVIDHLASKLRHLREIQIVIAPAQRAARGAATVAGVFSYAGRPFQWLSEGRWVAAYGWQELRKINIRGLAPRWAAACDVPDLELFPARYAGVETVQFRAALEVGVQHTALWCAARLRRIGLPFAIERWAHELDQVASMLDGFGSECGGMLVSLAGTDSSGSPKKVGWHLIAGGNHGPEIPCMAAALLAKKLASGKLAVRGAMPCMDLLTLEEFAPEFARWGISTLIEESAA